ncbi:putative glucan 1,3-beta-glucosidase A [Dichanthelium oligosanthes]|uniref:Putative glucan 1,3-beta-glucosidase A n=1 Tax=Dichanthelium oligosanthes TaxID=888268 RepID=A0A1E5VMN8_9POAL|nr:putative glucan 1,3-beta-glucosidase A [Dichanthelium oligosanthes]
MGCRGGTRLVKRRLCFFVLLLCASCLCSLSQAAKRTSPAPRPTVKPTPSPSQIIPAPAPAYPALPIRAVCLGGWLVTEGWILPPLFDAIPNKDLLDGTLVQFKSALRKTYLTADQGGGGAVVANKTQASDWETFKLWRMNETTFNFRTFGNQFVGIGASDGIIVATATVPALPETFQIVRCPFDKNRVRIKAANGYFVQAIATGEVIADYGEPTRWSDWDASVFLMTKVGEQLQGEYQLCNGYGTDKATPVLRDHWNTYIVEDDFKFIASSGLTAVRIPVGWWIASDPNPPAPYVGGSLQALDSAFKWAEKYNLGVIIDLHAAPGSQNPWEHSSSRDGTQEWGTTDANIAQTVQVIDFLASRYATSPSLFAVELLNEPAAPRATLDSLTKYYRDGYNAVRKHSPTAYVVMSNRLLSGNSTELLQFAAGFQGSVIDVHYYTMFNRMFSNLTAQQHIDFVRTNFSGELAAVTTQNGAPLTFVGEWVAEWKVPNATKEEYQKYAAAQMSVYRQATFGWAYWTVKNANNHWDLEWMIRNGYISLKG